MIDVSTIERRIDASYKDMSPQLRRAARFIMREPASVALYPLRWIADHAKVSPSTLVRLASHLGFASYNTFRNAFREGVRSGAERYASDAEELLRYRADNKFEALYKNTGALLVRNIEQSFGSIAARKVEAAGRRLAKSRRIYILGLRSNYSAAFYFHYVLRTFATNVVLLEGRMGMMIDELGELGPKDALLVISYDPYAIDAVRAVEHAISVGAAVIAITDGMLSPVARGAAHVFVVPTSSTSFYQSLVPTMALLEGLICFLVARKGRPVVERVKAEFERRERYGVYWRDGGR